MSQSLGKDLRYWRRNFRLTQLEVANAVGVSRGAYANWESDLANPSEDNLAKLKEIGFGGESWLPSSPEAFGFLSLPFFGSISASQVSKFIEFDYSELIEYVPAAWETKNCITCKTDSLSMLPLVEPDDLMMFVRDRTLKSGRVVMFQCTSGPIIIKQLRYKDGQYVLSSLHEQFEDVTAVGVQIGYLRGIVKGKLPNQDTFYRHDGNFADAFSKLK